jgi:hypothetical protein
MFGLGLDIAKIENQDRKNWVGIGPWTLSWSVARVRNRPVIPFRCDRICAYRVGDHRVTVPLILVVSLSSIFSLWILKRCSQRGGGEGHARCGALECH